MPRRVVAGKFRHPALRCHSRLHDLRSRRRSRHRPTRLRRRTAVGETPGAAHTACWPGSGPAAGWRPVSGPVRSPRWLPGHRQPHVQAGAVAAGISVSWISWGAEQSLEAVANVKDLHQAGELENACFGPVNPGRAGRASRNSSTAARRASPAPLRPERPTSVRGLDLAPVVITGRHSRLGRSASVLPDRGRTVCHR